jgi:predicted nucleic acid-binding protein
VRIHLDTSFLVDWRRSEERVESLVREIVAGDHEVSVDTVVETEFFSALRITRNAIALFDFLLEVGDLIPLTSEPARLAAGWLAPMDERQRRAHFADALIAAVAHSAGATLVTGDHRIAAIFPIALLAY